MANLGITVSVEQCRLLSFRPDNFELKDLLQFESNAQKLKIPTSIYSATLVDTTVLETLAATLGVPKPNHPRKIVLMCGAYLEEQISLASLFLLAVGYPVFLLRDVIIAKNVKHAHVHDQRLSQAGAVVTTSHQLIYEWAASELDISSKACLLEVLSQYAPRRSAAGLS